MKPENCTRSTCQICFCQIKSGEQTTSCPKCKVIFHKECWEEYGGCSIYGCEYAPEYKKQEIDEKFIHAMWGQETKLCPYCGEKIPIEAIQCPLCRENLKKAAPVSRQTIYKEKPKPDDPEEKKVRDISIMFFVGSVIGFFAPLVLIFCPFYYFQNREKLNNYTPIYKLLLISSIIFSALFIILFIVAKMVMRS